MRPIYQTVVGIGVSPPVPLDQYLTPFNVGVEIKISATATFKLQYTYDDVFADGYDPASGLWWDHATLAGAANKEGAITQPVRAIRLNATASTGNCKMTVLQAGVR